MVRAGGVAALGLALLGAAQEASAGIGGDGDSGAPTTTLSNSHLAVSATTAQAKLFDFGPVFDPTPPSGCQVTIAWGDGQTSPASLGPADSNSEQEVTASHTYAQAGAYQATQSASGSGCITGTPTVTGNPPSVNTNYDTKILDVTVTDPAAAATGGGGTTAATSGASTGTGDTTVQAPASLCGRSRLFDLLDVYPAQGHVQLIGYADPHLAGQTVSLLSAWNRTVVAKAVVGRNGYFRATAPLPAARIRGTNTARYLARQGSYQSAPLKLTRRMFVFGLKPAARGNVAITGQITPPLAHQGAPIIIYRRDNCQQPGYTRLTGHVQLNKRTGQFTVIAPAPPASATGAVYRLNTKVRNSQANAKLFPTFTLPRTLTIS